MSAGPYGWGWARVTGPPDGLERLVGDLHTFTATLDAAGYGPYLLCTAVCFHRETGRSGCSSSIRRSGGRSTRSPPPPDVPGENRRNNLVEAHARDALAAELPMEPDTARWFPSGTRPASERRALREGEHLVEGDAGVVRGLLVHLDDVLHPAAASDSSDSTRCGRSMRFIVEQ